MRHSVGALALVVLAACGGSSSSGQPDGGGAQDAGPDGAAPDAARPDAVPPGTLSVLAADQLDPHGIAVDGTSVYWTNNATSGQIMRIDRGGGTPVELQTAQVGPQAIAVAGGTVYWNNLGDVAVPGSVMSAPAAGGIATPLATGLMWPRQSALDTTNGFMVWTTDDGLVQKVPADGGAVTTLANETDGASDVAVDGSFVYYVAWGAGGMGTAIKRIPIGGGTATTVLSGVYQNGLIAANGALYWKDCTNLPPPRSCMIMTMPTDGGGATAVAVEEGNGDIQARIAIDSQHVYWTAWGAGTVSRAPLAGGTPEVLATGQLNPDGIAVDDQAVYWANFDAFNGAVMKLTK